MSIRTALASGCRATFATHSRPPMMIPACGPPSSLSPEKNPSVDACGSTLLRHRLVRQPIRARVQQAAAAQIVHHRHPCAPSHRSQLAYGGRMREPHYAEVRCVDRTGSRPCSRRLRLRSPWRMCDWSSRPRPDLAPLWRSTSGILNPPPISTASPRETITSLPAATAASPSMSADALLFTTSAASAPVAWQTRSEMRACLDPRFPSLRSSSRLLYPDAAMATAFRLSSLSGARPRFVCSTTPVALTTRRGPRRPARRRAPSHRLRQLRKGRGIRARAHRRARRAQLLARHLYDGVRASICPSARRLSDQREPR